RLVIIIDRKRLCTRSHRSFPTQDMEPAGEQKGSAPLVTPPESRGQGDPWRTGFPAFAGKANNLWYCQNDFRPASTTERILMAILTRRSVLRSSLGLAFAGALARPHIANAAATTAEVWWTQGFAQEEDASFRAMVADYEKASGDKIDYSLIPFAPLRQ